DAGDDVARPPGRQQPPRARAAGVDEVERDARAAAGDAGELEVALAGRLAVAHGDVREDQLLGVRVVDADQRLAVTRAHEPLVDGEGTDRRGAVAAIAVVLDDRRLHVHLRERVVDVGVGVRGRADDARLGQRRDAAAQPVELATVGVGAAERGQEDPIAWHAGRRKIVGAEDEAATRATAHVDGANLFLHYARAFVCASRPPANTTP